MKPDGRSLDVAVVGLGQAGGNLAAEFFRRGYRALALNTAETDLSALDPGGVFPALPAERRLYVGLDGYDGAGADPTYGRECLREHADRIRAAVVKQAGGADAVILCAGLGGGTGSSLISLVEILDGEQIPLVALMTLPTAGESGLAKVNAVRAVNELVDAPLLGWIFADNDRISSLNPDLPIVDYFGHVNAQIIAPLDDLNRLNDRDDLVPIRSFDGEDFRKLLLSGGVLNYATTVLGELNPAAAVGAVETAIRDSELMPSGFDLARVSYLGLVLEAPERVLEHASMRVFEAIAGELKARTGGAAIYQGIYRTGPDHPITLRLIASTPSLPHRMREILTDARREGQVLGEKVAEALPTLELGEIAGFDLFRTKTRPSTRPRRAPPSPRRPAELLEEIADEVAPRRLRPSVDVTTERAPVEERPPEPRPRTRPVPLPPLSNPRSGTRAGEEADMAPRPRRPRPRGPEIDSLDHDEEPTTARPGLAGPEKEIGTQQIDVAAALSRASAEARPAGGSARPPEPAFEEDRLGRSEPPVSTDGVDTGDLPDPATYDQLVARFLETNSDAERAGVKARLEEDSDSDITVVRYYAVEAMAKLGRRTFGEALLRATEDENEAVRELAAEALRR